MNDNKATIGSLIELPVSGLSENYKELLESLTVDNPEYMNARFFGKGRVSDKIPRKLFFFKVNEINKSILVPRNIDRKYLDGYTIRYDVSEGRKIPHGPSDKFKLRPVQKDFWDNKIIPTIDSRKIRRPFDFLLNAECGSGKTVMGLYLANHYQVNTLVTVTLKRIGEQFINAVRDLFPNWSCGWEKDGKDYDITVATYSLLSSDKYDENYFSRFGHIIMDEFHRCGAETYSKILEKSPCIYRTSLTATFRRKDGLHKILKQHAGQIVEMPKSGLKASIYPVTTFCTIEEEQFRNMSRFPTKPKNLSPYTDVVVRSKDTRKELDRGMIISISGEPAVIEIKSSTTRKTVKYNSNDVNIFELGIISSSLVDTEVSNLSDRNNNIVELILNLRNSGRKVLLLSKRKEQLYKLMESLGQVIDDCAVYVSDNDKDYVDYCKQTKNSLLEYKEWLFSDASVILGIDKLAQEGLDIPHFDTLIFAHPINDIEQAIGRIVREHPQKKKPIGIFLVDRISNYDNAFYGKKGAKKMFFDLGHTVHRETNFSELNQMIVKGTIPN